MCFSLGSVLFMVSDKPKCAQSNKYVQYRRSFLLQCWNKVFNSWMPSCVQGRLLQIDSVLEKNPPRNSELDQTSFPVTKLECDS